MPPRLASPRRTATVLLVLAEALVMLAIASLAIRFLPFRQVMRAAAWQGRRSASADMGATVRRVSWSVRRWADILPWRVVCFQQGLAGQWMLRRRGVRSLLHYGVDPRAPEGLSAHVWVTAGEQTVLGGGDAPRHARIMTCPASAVR